MSIDTIRRAPALPTATPEAAGFSSAKLNAVVDHFAREVAKGELPNAAFALARDGKVFWRRHLGYHDLASRRPVTEDSIYRLLSLTKAVTGVALMTLIDDGKVALDDPVSRYVPEFADTQVWDDGKIAPLVRPITLLDLASHTSGLTSGFMPGPVPTQYLENGLQEGTWESQQPTLAAYVRKLASMPLLVQPGTEFNYSEGMAVLGRVVEVASGQRYGDYVQDRILGPLGMTDAAFWVPPEKYDRLVTNYGYRAESGLYPYEAMDFPNPVGPPMRILQMDRRPGADLGGAGLAGTVDDVLRFAMMLAGGGALGGTRVLSPEGVKRMAAPHVRGVVGPDALVKPPFDARGRGLDMGLTVYTVIDCDLADSAASVGSFGFGGSAGTRFWADPATGVAGVLFTQRMSCPPEPFAAFQRLVYGALER